MQRSEYLGRRTEARGEPGALCMNGEISLGGIGELFRPEKKKGEVVVGSGEGVDERGRAYWVPDDLRCGRGASLVTGTCGCAIARRL